jgi:predicted nucleotidyltransferase
MNIEQLKEKGLIVFEGIVGSQAYGISTPESDVDIKGVFIQPLEDILGFGYVEQVSDEKNDTTYYELKRFLQLLQTNNPNILELLNLPEDCILYKDPIFDEILSRKKSFISSKCSLSFGGYAVEQIKKARGMNKKIVNPMEPERKGVLDFCYVPFEQGSIPVKEYLKMQDWSQEACGLSSIPHMRFTYSVYYNKAQDLEKKGVKVPVLNYYRGIVTNEETSNDVCLSDIPKGVMPDFIMQFNSDGYSTYCRTYKEYWDWVAKRNPKRFSDNMLHGGGYDGKNCAHALRLLEMAIEIGEGKGINVRRENREELLGIRRGEWEYEDLIAKIEFLNSKLEKTFAASQLPDNVDSNIIDQILIKIRKKWYFHEKVYDDKNI